MDLIQQLILDLGKRQPVSLSINELGKEILDWTNRQQYKTRNEEIRVKHICRLAIALIYSGWKKRVPTLQTTIEFGEKLSKCDKITALQLAQVLVFETDLSSDAHLEEFLVEISKTITLLIHSADINTSNLSDYFVFDYSKHLNDMSLDRDKYFDIQDMSKLLDFFILWDFHKKAKGIKSTESTYGKSKDKPKKPEKQSLTHEEALNRLTLLMESAERADYYVDKLKKCHNVPDVVRHVVREMIADLQTKIDYDTAVSRDFWDIIQPLVSFSEGFSKRNPYRLVVKYCSDLK